MTCKHNWNFTGPSTLTCTRCGAETGPKTPEQLAKEMMEELRAWFTVSEINDWADKYEAKLKEKNGKQIYLGLFPTAELAHQAYKENT